MMSVEEVVRGMMAAVDEGEMETAAGYLAADFVFSGPVPEPLGKAQWVGLQRQLLTAFPDWSFNLKEVQVDGSVATTTHQITGTHTGELDLSPMGLPKIPATGKTIRLPEEQARCTVEKGKIIRVEIEANPESGVPGILKQLGVEMPVSDS
ncbi:MAG: nuclear transport factor 2 family protein [Chloroflexota bacterium]